MTKKAQQNSQKNLLNQINIANIKSPIQTVFSRLEKMEKLKSLARKLNQTHHFCRAEFTRGKSLGDKNFSFVHYFLYNDLFINFDVFIKYFIHISKLKPLLFCFTDLPFHNNSFDCKDFLPCFIVSRKVVLSSEKINWGFRSYLGSIYFFVGDKSFEA